MAKEKTLDEYNPYKNLDDAKAKQRGDTHRLKRDDVIQYMMRDWLEGKKTIPDEFSAVVRRLIDFKDTSAANTDPFYDTEEDKERMNQAGVITGAKEKLVAYVEVPSFFAPIRNLQVCDPSNYYFPLLRVDVSKTNMKGERPITLNEIIIIQFKNKNNYIEPSFKKFPKGRPVFFESDFKPKEGRISAALRAFGAASGGMKEKCQAV